MYDVEVDVCVSVRELEDVLWFPQCDPSSLPPIEKQHYKYYTICLHPTIFLFNTFVVFTFSKRIILESFKLVKLFILSKLFRLMHFNQTDPGH